MAQLYFHHGAMNSGKSIEVLKVAYSYKEQNKETILLTSSLDTRSGKSYVASRIGIKQVAQAVNPDTDVLILIQSIINKIDKQIFAVIVDESQFLTEKQVIQLTQVVDNLGIPVLCYGLKNDFQNKLFEGSQALLVYADKIMEIKTVCMFCNKKATMNLRIHNGHPIYHGEQVLIGGNESYISVCRQCYNHPELEKKIEENLNEK